MSAWICLLFRGEFGLYYVSSIKDGVGDSVGYFKYRISLGHHYKIYCKSVDGGREVPLDAMKMHECLGIQLNEKNETGVVITLGHKDAILHSYVSCSETKALVPPAKYANADIIEYPHPQQPFHGSKVLDIHMNRPPILLGGIDGSVVEWRGNVSTGLSLAICTLYDFLIFMCRKTGVNLMQYEILQFGSQSYGWSITLGLQHNEEADRFYMKMYLDAVGGYEGHLKGFKG